MNDLGEQNLMKRSILVDKYSGKKNVNFDVFSKCDGLFEVLKSFDMMNDFIKYNPNSYNFLINVDDSCDKEEFKRIAVSVEKFIKANMSHIISYENLFIDKNLLNKW